MDTIVLNLFGGPGSGKSTGAAYIFSKLKMNGIDCEYVQEFAKDKVWEENKFVFNNQAYIFGKQYYRIARLLGKVEVVITDSPLLLSVIYNNDEVLGEDFDKVVTNVHNSMNNISYFIKRVKEYNPNGRNQTEAESDCLSNLIKLLLDDTCNNYSVVSGDINGYDSIVEDMIRIIKERKESNNVE